MAVPDFQTLMLPVLRLIASGHETIPRCLPSLIDEFSISPEEASTLLPSGKQTVLANRAHWARNYMSQAGLVHPIRRGHYELTSDGRALLATQPKRIDKETLLAFPQFREWISRSSQRTDLADLRHDTPLETISGDETARRPPDRRRCDEGGIRDHIRFFRRGSGIPRQGATSHCAHQWPGTCPHDDHA